MSSLDRAIKKTIAYSAFFDYYLSPSETHFWLITSHLVSFSKVKRSLPLTGPSLLSIKKKKRRLGYSRQKIAQAKRIASILMLIPTIQLVAVTGSVAVGDARYTDDIDLLIITSNHSLWITRPFVLLLLSLFSRRRLPRQTYHSAAHSFCPNLWMEARTLTVPRIKQNLYTAHEVLFVTPIYDRSCVHQLFLDRNYWVKKYLANAYLQSINKEPKKDPSHFFGFLLFPLNLILFIFQYIYMKPKLTTEHIGLGSAYFHTKDYDKKIKKHLGQILR